MCILLPALLLTAAPQSDPRLDWWRDARFGMFVHWGPVSLRGTEIGWSRAGARPGRSDVGTQVPRELYDNLYRQFNPTEFDATEWVRIAQAAGIKYLVFTTKHHDGFCMFDSALTEYKITNSPIHRDLLKELANACHAAGLRLGFYYSPPDWHHPDYRTAHHDRYIEYLHGQLKELCSNYGQVDLIWFDGLGGKATDWDSERLFEELKALQPEILLNNRAGLPGDYDTPEQRIGGLNLERPWESCITICRQWSWKPDDKLKSYEECVQTLAKCAGGDGNLLLNVGPQPTGAIEPRQVAVLKQLGDWLKVHGESIYGTRGGPYKPGPWGASTRRGHTIYLHVLDPELTELLLPPLEARVVGSRLLGGGAVTAEQTADALMLHLPAADGPDRVVVLELDRDAWGLPLRAAPPHGLLSFERPAKASNVFQGKVGSYGPAKALDGDLHTRWATDAGVHAAWLEVDFGEGTTFDRVVLREEFGRVRRFELQVPDGAEWKPIHLGTTIGEKLVIDLAATVTSNKLRLVIGDATDGPTLWEIEVRQR